MFLKCHSLLRLAVCFCVDVHGSLLILFGAFFSTNFVVFFLLTSFWNHDQCHGCGSLFHCGLDLQSLWLKLEKCSLSTKTEIRYRDDNLLVPVVAFNLNICVSLTSNLQ